MKFLVFIGSFLLNLSKGLASFFLSGGAVLFVAVASFATLCSSLYDVFYDNSEFVIDAATMVTQFIGELSKIGSNDVSAYLVYSTAVDSLISWTVSFISSFFIILTFVLFGIVSSFLGIVIPLVVFRVSFFIKSKIVSSIGI